MGTVYDIYVQHAMTQFNTVQIRVPYETVNNSAGNAGEHALRVGEYAPIHDQAQYPTVANKSLSPPSYRGTIHKIIIAFSMYTNGAKVLNTRQGSGALTCVNGIRFLSLSWVIWGHTYAFIVFFVDNLVPVYQDLTKRWTMQVLLQGTFSVDTFFVLSGLLVTYLTLREMKKGSGRFRINWGLYYFHRFWRLTPPYMLVLMVYAVTTKYWATGPLWPEQGAMDQFCNETWWTNLIYVNNFVQMDKMCMGWSWYLSNDMQFYVVSPLILIPLFWHIVAGGAMLLYFLLASLIYTGLMCSIHNFGPGLATQSDQLTYFDLVYIKPYARIGPYLMGMVVGYVLYLTECKPKMNKMIALGGWVVATACALAVVYGVYDVYQGHPLSNDVGAFYNTMSRTVWGACVGWVIYACCTGYGGFVNTLLSWGAFVPLGRLTYCAYLIHPIIMFVVYSVRERLIFVTDVSATYFFFGHMVMTYGCAFVVSMVFEAPMMGLEKAILNRDKSV
ncbi:nose resistant to fluoxetine protein 6 [Lingula anatina]|uniref:Nose resistant to fluoxetine protein 6 n=1 Tax=Lingula anatina TaxID=7574 RepID=A0A1S3HXW1_LINAN|nr:nose resistant to fluoxetine protein 6 [Lingula anatina]|eukprot:XP_013390848.1 nose resistant to fluoxetine protein 6 [Lingula anatina]